MTPAPRALIAEDEPLLAAALRSELQKAWPELQIVAQVGDGLSAVEQSLALRPEVLFFDIRMPGQTGLEAALELADAWPAQQPFPALVFVTAYDQYAVQAFEAQAVDYLLKPVQSARLEKAVQKLRKKLMDQAQAATNSVANTSSLGLDVQRTVDQLRELLATSALQTPSSPSSPSSPSLPPSPSSATRPPTLSIIQASQGSQIHMVPVADVVYFEAADKYVRVLTAEHEYLIRTPLKELIEQLDPQQFWQVHRSTLVRASAITSVVRDEAGKLHLSLRHRPEKLAVSRIYAHLFKAM